MPFHVTITTYILCIIPLERPYYLIDHSRRGRGEGEGVGEGACEEEFGV